MGGRERERERPRAPLVDRSKDHYKTCCSSFCLHISEGPGVIRLSAAALCCAPGYHVGSKGPSKRSPQPVAAPIFTLTAANCPYEMPFHSKISSNMSFTPYQTTQCPPPPPNHIFVVFPSFELLYLKVQGSAC